MVSLTSCAYPLLVDGPYLDRLRDALQVDGIVAGEVTAVVLLGKGAAAESPEINNFPNKKILKFEYRFSPCVRAEPLAV